MTSEQVPVFIPAELECRDFNQLACLRFYYDLPNGEKPPTAGELFTALTPEQAVDLVNYLEGYIHRSNLEQD